jgi:Mg/Co/Ni transporter MgtE
MILSASPIKTVGIVPVKEYQCGKDLKRECKAKKVLDEISDEISYIFSSSSLLARRQQHTRFRVLQKDIFYPHFYKSSKLEFFSKIASENKVSHLIFAKFDEQEINKSLNEGAKDLVLNLKVYIYDLKDNKLLEEEVKIKTYDVLLQSCDYDPEETQSMLKNKIITMFNKLYKED